MFDNQIVGLTRFSIPSTDAFEISQKSLEECEAILYQPERLERRFALFEKFCLPSLQNQTDTDFLAIILIGRNLPKQYRDRLMDGIDQYDHMVLAEVKPAKHFKMINTVVQALPAFDYTHRTTFRLDDDDMVDVNYVARIRKAANVMSALSSESPFALAHHLGYYLDLSEGEPKFYEVRENLPPSMALSVTAPIEWKSNIYSWNHRFVPKKCSTYSDLTELSFIRTMHDLNDAPRNAAFDSKPIPLETIEKTLQSRFGLSLADAISTAQETAG